MAHGHPPMPKVFLVRHGQTEWSLNGRHTGTTDIPLTAEGEKLITELAPRIVGPGKLLGENIMHAFVSPRTRARKTFELLYQGQQPPPNSTEEGVREWTYGDYEGRTAQDIRANSNPTWDIWVDGCEGGESAEEVSARCDAMIDRIKGMCRKHQEGGSQEQPGDVLIVSHGHFTRCFLTRWCALPLTQGRLFVADTGAISVCGFQHGSFDERSLLGLNLFGEI